MIWVSEYKIKEKIFLAIQKEVLKLTGLKKWNDLSQPTTFYVKEK